jgi:hypothetical protein
MKKLLLFSLLGLYLMTACEDKQDTGGDPSQPLVFNSLEADKYTLIPGETATIVASASGYQLSYHWSASAGDLVTTGILSEVLYVPSPCHVGENTISCEVRDGNNNSETRSIIIVVE